MIDTNVIKNVTRQDDIAVINLVKSASDEEIKAVVDGLSEMLIKVTDWSQIPDGFRGLLLIAKNSDHEYPNKIFYKVFDAIKPIPDWMVNMSRIFPMRKK